MPDLPGRRLAAAALVLAFLGAAPADAQAPPPEPPPPRLANSVDALARAHLRIVPGEPDVQPAVAGAGDVNGDGLADLVVGVSPFGCEARSGTAYVVFGTREPATVNLGDLGDRGFAIRGTGQDALGAAVDGAGDVNGDGLADLVVGAPAEGFEGGLSPADKRFARGAGYVIFGKRGTEPVDVTALGDGGYRILGRRTQVDCSRDGGVAGLGDVNGDGRADVLVAPSAPASPPTPAAAVVFGRQAGDVALDALGDGGYELLPAQASVFNAAGDVNGDGLGDVVVGEPGAAPTGTCNAGRATVLFGGPRTEPVSVAAPGSEGIAVVGAMGGRPGKFDCQGGDLLGASVAPAGDLDGDGLGDVALGGSSGTVLLRGQRAGGTVDVSRADTGAVRVRDLFGAQGAGDVTGDGRTDVIGMGAAIFSVAAVVPGFSALGGAEPLPPGPGGWLLRARRPTAPTGVGDVNGDGRDDVSLVDAGDPSHGSFTSSVLVVTERPTLASGRCANFTSGSNGDDTAPGSDEGDRILGYARYDRLAGFGGDDCLAGGSGSDTLNGGDGDDRLEGGDDPDALAGDAGSDVLYGGRGRDLMAGGAGDDTIDAADGAIDRVDCGPGVDQVRADAFDRVRGCERERLIGGRPRSCVTPLIKVRGPRRARVGKLVTLRVEIDAPSPVASLNLSVTWGYGAVDVVGRTGDRSYPVFIRQGRQIERPRIRFGAAGRFQTRVTAASLPSPGCGDQPDYVMAPPVLIRVR